LQSSGNDGYTESVRINLFAAGRRILFGCRRVPFSFLINSSEEKMVKKLLEKFVFVAIFWLLCTVSASAGTLNIISSSDFKEMLDTQEPVIIADIQKTNNFRKHHFYAAIETNAYPVKTSSQRKKLETIVKMFEKTGDPIVIVGPRGTSGSKRACEYLQEEGVPQDKIFLLKGGIREWPYKELLMDIAGGCA
jgi:rhodanese-related sulfurtransferase